MKISIQFFARARDLAGCDSLALELPSPTTVAQLRHDLAARYPRLADFLPRCAIAVDAEFAQDNTILIDGSQVALVPPVSGG